MKHNGIEVFIGEKVGDNLKAQGNVAIAWDGIVFATANSIREIVPAETTRRRAAAEVEAEAEGKGRADFPDQSIVLFG